MKEKETVKIPISKRKGLKKARPKLSSGNVHDIKGPADLKNFEFSPKKDFDIRKFLFIAVPILAAVLILAGLANWYRDYQNDKQVQMETETKELYQPAEETLTEPEPEPEPEPLPQVEILETETGWLNVREGAGIGFEIVTRVYPGEKYTLLEEIEEWYRIELEEDQEGWVFSQYAIKE